MSPADFDDAMRRGDLRIAFTGMSNAGKTTAGKTLAKTKKFQHIEVDADIERELGLTDTGAMAEWLGHPDSARFHERQARYLESEERHTTRDRAGGNVVLDTTGSFVHLSENARQYVRNGYLVVHLDVGEKKVDELIERFFAVPKPVIWGEFFKPKAGESAHKTLARCYPDLLQERLKRFRADAHVNVPVQTMDLKKADSVVGRIRDALAV